MINMTLKGSSFQTNFVEKTRSVEIHCDATETRQIKIINLVFLPHCLQ